MTQQYTGRNNVTISMPDGGSVPIVSQTEIEPMKTALSLMLALITTTALTEPLPVPKPPGAGRLHPLQKGVDVPAGSCGRACAKESDHRQLARRLLPQYGLGQKQGKRLIISRPPTGEKSDIANPLPYPFYLVEELICRTHGSVPFCNIATS